MWNHRQNNQINSYDSNKNDPMLKVNYTNRFNKILRKDLRLLKDLANNLYGFDILKSQELPIIRDIPDTRPLKCQSVKFDSNDLQPVSIIIPVFNEFYSVLLRTVYTIIARSPNNLISEIILIDDHSMYYDTKLAFENLKKTFSQVIVHRLNERKGLIKAKIIGETLAKSKILIYMDSHTEVNINWLEPLILEISSNPMHTVAIPTIDSIDPESFEYIASPVVKGGFNWGLFFTWIKISDFKHSINSIDPIFTPTFSGGYFAISKEMYEYFGGFDPQMKTWGGENLEMSFRIWQCGGQIKILPCSRLGHIFRSKKPYANSDSGDHWLENTLRMAHIWMDEYIEKFYQVRPEAKTYKFGNIRERKKLRVRTRSPIGVAAVITPWNLPLYLLTFKLAPCIMYGNTCICKPSEFTSLTAWKLCHLIKEAGFPNGVINFVFGDGPNVGNALIRNKNIDLITFTGSTLIGEHIQKATVGNFVKLSLELGGKNAAIVCADADFDHALESCINSSFTNQGEVCLCTSRIYVEQSIYEKFLKAFVEKTKQLVVGDPLKAETFMGPLISQIHKEKVLGYINSCQGRLLCDHGIDSLNLPETHKNGFFVAPTVFTDVPETDPILYDEVFGPVTCIVPFESYEEVIKKVNSVRYGLCAVIHTKNQSTAISIAKKLEVGTVWINCWIIRDLRMPFGGWKKSGIGNEGQEESRDFYTNLKTICFKY